MGGNVATGDFRYAYAATEKKEGESQIYRSAVLSEGEPLTTLEYETIDTLKKAFMYVYLILDEFQNGIQISYF